MALLFFEKGRNKVGLWRQESVPSISITLGSGSGSAIVGINLLYHIGVQRVRDINNHGTSGAGVSALETDG